MTELRVLPDAATIAAFAAERLVDVAGRGGHIALSGGSTPRAAYERAAGALDDWSRATLWFGDERCVPTGDERSNHGMVEAALLERLPESGRPRVFRIRGEDGPERAAAAYEAQLRAELGDEPRLDLVLLGLGADAHTASLFPGKPAVEETGRLVAPVPEAGLEPFVPRVTFTFRLIDAGREVVFLVAGSDKAAAVRRAFGPDPDASAPASRVQPTDAELLVALDEPAAAELKG